MLEKNQFLIFNHVLSELYRCRTYQDLGDAFLPMLRMLIPYRYASIMRRAEAGPSIHLVDPLCVPAAFAEAERRYMRFAADDYTAWLSCCREATLFRESDLVGEQQRLRSTIYQECYQPFEVYDSLQYGIVCNGQPLGALSLFRCREDGPFSDHELFLLRSVGTHLNQQMAALLAGTPPAGGSPDHSLAAVAARHGLTLRERQLLEELTRFRNNQEIAEALSVRASTLQKHFQNMFRKFGVTSRCWRRAPCPGCPLSPRANKKGPARRQVLLPLFFSVHESGRGTPGSPPSGGSQKSAGGCPLPR